MAERTMEELLQAPTEGYGEAIVLPEINADHFEIKTNLLQLVQANPFYGRETVEGALGWGYISLGAFRIWCLQAIRLTTTRVFVSLSTTIRVRFGTAAFRGCLVLLFHGTERLVAGLQPKRAVWFIGVKGVFGLGINTQHRGV
ncbi:hypothetical protein Tco_0502772 [Tanacetum coccineum]